MKRKCIVCEGEACRGSYIFWELCKQCDQALHRYSGRAAELSIRGWIARRIRAHERARFRHLESVAYARAKRDADIDRRALIESLRRVLNESRPLV